MGQKERGGAACQLNAADDWLKQTLKDRWRWSESGSESGSGGGGISWNQGAWSMDGPESLSSKSRGPMGSALGSGILGLASMSCGIL